MVPNDEHSGETGLLHPTLDDLRLALLRVARQGCWCEHRRKPCETHDAFDDGLCVMMGSLTQVGPISTEEFVSRTTHDEPLWGVSEEGHRVVSLFGRTRGASDG